ncbi:hypothetical protein [Streptomyces sp. NPDC055287]
MTSTRTGYGSLKSAGADTVTSTAVTATGTETAARVVDAGKVYGRGGTDGARPSDRPTPKRAS